MLPNSKMAFSRPPILPSKVFQAPSPAMGEMKPAIRAGTFWPFHCLTRMPLSGMSKQVNKTWAPPILAFISTGAKSLAPVGNWSWPRTSQPFFSNQPFMAPAVPRAQSTSWLSR